MLYYNNKPVNSQRRRTLNERFFQWCTFKSDTQELRDSIESDFESVKTETMNEKYFLLPGRRKVMPRMINDETFEVISLLNDNEPVEHWEKSITTSFPMKRTTSATIGSALPRFRGSLNSVMTADSLTESLQRKSKYFETVKSCHVYKNGEVTAEISEIEIEGKTQYSVTLQSANKEALMAFVKAYDLKSGDNMNIADLLLTA